MMTFTVPDMSVTDSYTDKEVITKTANTTNKITVTDASDPKEIMNATVNGNSITFDQSIRDVSGDGYTATATFSGTGAINGKTLTATGTLKYSRNGANYNGTWSAVWAKQ